MGEALIIKNVILTISGFISTTVSYFLYNELYMIVMVHMDLFVNCLIIGLMNNWNELHYKRLCGICILICFRKCNPYTAETELQLAEVSSESRWSQKMKRYVSNRDIKVTTPSAISLSHVPS